MNRIFNDIRAASCTAGLLLLLAAPWAAVAQTPD